MNPDYYFTAVALIAFALYIPFIYQVFKNDDDENGPRPS